MNSNQDHPAEIGLSQNARFIRSTYRKAVRPGMLSILSVNINVVVDGILVSQRIGADALAAINLSLPVYWALCVVGSLLAAGTEIPAARALGMGNARKQDAFFCTGLNAAVIASLVITVLGLLLRRPIVTFLGANDATRDYVMQYVVITLIGALPKIGLYIPFWYLRLDGKNSDVAIMMTGMTVINILLDVLFVFFLNMGVFGAGLASVVATAAAFLYGMHCLLGRGGARRWRWLWVSRKDWVAILSAGFPSAFNNLCATVRLLVINSLLMARGGAGLVAVFTAVNGISGFGDCVTLGVPAAGGVMLSVFSGERDFASCRLLLREEWKTGCFSALGFLAATALLSRPIAMIYRLPGSMLTPLLWLSLSLFPALLLNILSTCYNMSGQNLWANGIIFLRNILATWAALLLALETGMPLFSFLLTAELITLALWVAATGIHHLRRPRDSRFLLFDTENERNGKVLNFSVAPDVDEIVNASQRISHFCAANGMSLRSTMHLEMSMEEMMTLIRHVNLERGAAELHFDLRAYCIGSLTGVRIRYNGLAFNPFASPPASDDPDGDLYLGARMILKIAEMTNYQRVFGINMLNIILKGD